MIKFVLRKAIILVALFQFASVGKAQQLVSISGYITEKSTGEMLGGVAIALYPSRYSTSSNSYGFYSISVRKNIPQKIYYRFPGFQLDSFIWSANTDTSFSVGLVLMQQGEDGFEKIKEVEIVSKKSTIADKVEMSKIDIPINQIKEIPALLGEKDVMKVIQLLPGVQKGGEGQSGIYVRGGGPDQNLIILDEAIVYNASHLFGFFSVFNGDALRSVELTKGGFPARYGGRLSSVIDLNMKEGNNQKFTGELGVGILSSRFTLEGPIKKGKSSFMVSGRRTYIDVLAQPLIMAVSDGNNGGYYFYDMNAKYNYIISDKDKLFISGYFGRDRFYASDNSFNHKNEFSFGWGNRTMTGRWNHQFTPRLFSNLSLIYSHYDLTIGATDESVKEKFELSYSSTINDYGIKYDFDWRPIPNHLLRFGLSSINHNFSPSAMVFKVGTTDLFNKSVEIIKTLESGIYIEDQIKIDEIKIMPSLRISHYLVGNKTIVNPEPRLSFSYNLSKDKAIKFAYSLMNQYMHLLSSSGISLPTDLWVPATENLKPMKSEQFALGFAKDFKGGISLNIEGYYKTMQNMLQYKNGSSSFLSDNLDPSATADSRSWEQLVTSGKGTSYGTELFLQKQMGQFSGWIGYTLSWTTLQFDDLNGGKPFYAKYDRRHDISLVGIYKIDKRMSISATWVYGTGNAISIPQGTMVANSHQMSNYPAIWNPNFNSSNSQIDFGARNSFRMEPYHRLDIGVRYSTPLKRGTRTWEFSLYNAYNRSNPYFYFGGNVDGVNLLRKITLFPVIPSLSWSFKFK